MPGIRIINLRGMKDNIEFGNLNLRQEYQL